MGGAEERRKEESRPLRPRGSGRRERVRTGSSSRYFSVMAQSQLANLAPGLSTRKISLRDVGRNTFRKQIKV